MEQDTGCLQGRVVRLLAHTVEVAPLGGGVSLICSLRGHLKRGRKRKTSLLVVGDLVTLERVGSDGGVIVAIQDRHSFLARRSSCRGSREQLLAANVDRLFIVTSLVAPRLKPHLIDRYLLAAHQGNMTPTLILNKVDLLNLPPPGIDRAHLTKERRLFEQVAALYAGLGVSVIPTSCSTGSGMSTLKREMEGQTNLFSGQSGVGKTSLLNVMLGMEMRVQGLASGKRVRGGMHTTSSAQLLPLESGGFCVDTPGIRALSLPRFSLVDLEAIFIEFKPYAVSCRFAGCTHLHEPSCAVKEALVEGQISTMRYNSYTFLVKDLTERRLLF